MTHQFGIGKHRTRGGEIAYVSYDTGLGTWRLYGGFYPESKYPTWTAEGKYSGSGEHPRDLIERIDEESAQKPSMKSWEEAFARDAWTDITHSLPGHRQVVVVEDEEGRIAVAGMVMNSGLEVVRPAYPYEWFEFGTVKRWRVV